MSADTNLVHRFCTPQFIPFSEFENTAFSNAKKVEFPFENENLTGYTWGEGKTVMLIHGWGSRASHLAVLGRFLAKAGFRVFVFDAPAHSSTTFPLKKSSTNMFEYGKAIYEVAVSIGPIYAAIGHSFGAACAAFTLSGISAFSKYKISAEKLILISTPPKLTDVYLSFCRRDQTGEKGFAVLKSTLEKEFNFASEDYTIENSLRNISSDILLIHDTEDEEFLVSDIYQLKKTFPGIKIFISEGYGHKRILGNRLMMARIKNYLLDE